MTNRDVSPTSFSNLWSPSNGDFYTTDREGQWYHVDHYTRCWHPVAGPPADARPCGNVRAQMAQRAVDLEVR
jgi:hypothetical protein